MIDERLSRDIEQGAIARPRYSTDVIKTEGGHEFRVPRWRYPLFTFEFNLAPGDPEEPEFDGYDETLEEFINLWHCCGGRDETFLFRHWSDWRARAQPIGTGDGATLVFQLYRVYQRGAITRQRKITRPVAGTLVAYVNGVVAAAALDAETGLITFTVAPANGTAITADFDFDIPVRFDDDSLELVALTKDLDQPVNIVLAEQRERSAA